MKKIQWNSIKKIIPSISSHLSKPISKINATLHFPWKQHILSWKRKILQFHFSDFEIHDFHKKLQTLFQKKFFQTYTTPLTVMMCTYLTSDLSSLWLEDQIPPPPPLPAAFSQKTSLGPSFAQYTNIFSRNLFNSKGHIPPAKGALSSRPQNFAPTRTTLPLAIVGVVIFQERLRSIVALENTQKKEVYATRILDEIPNLLKVTRIEAKKVFFQNLKNNKVEYIDLPEDNASKQALHLGQSSSQPGIKKVSPTQFNIQRTEIQSALQNLNELLTQARAVPNFENGNPNGYKLFEIAPGSLYEKLGMQNGDVITGVNGEGINDPAKAFQLLSELKNSNHVEISIKRNGKEQTLIYEISQ